jgi:hypothetical protein
MPFDFKFQYGLDNLRAFIGVRPICMGKGKLKIMI